MQFYSMYDQNDAGEIESLVRSQPSCTLVTVAADGRIECGLFNHAGPIHDNGTSTYFLHLNRKDSQVKSLKDRGAATLVFQEILAVIPSHWVNDAYAGAATMYYRYVELDCLVRVLEDPAGMTDAFERLMRQHQPEGGFEKLDHRSPTYEKSYAMLSVVEMTPRATRAKWKLGQNHPVEKRRTIVEHLRKRGRSGDLRAADEVERWIARH